MKKTVKTEKIIAAARVLGAVDTEKMEDKEQILLVPVGFRIKKIAEAYEAYQQEVIEKLRPKDFDALTAKEQAGEAFTPEEQERVRKYNTSVAECLRKEAEKEIELDFEPLSRQAILNLKKGTKGMNFGTMLELMELLCEDAAEASAPETAETENE